MTYEQRLQKEAEELAALFIAEGLATPVCREDCIRLEKSLEPIVKYLLAKQAEAYRAGYEEGMEDEYQFHINNAQRLEDLNLLLLNLGLVPQTNQDEEITK